MVLILSPVPPGVSVVLKVRDAAMSCLVDIYRHVGERVRMDLGKKGLPQSRCVQVLLCFTSCLCFLSPASPEAPQTWIVGAGTGPLGGLMKKF